MLLVAPLAYIGATYYNGEDGLQKVKKLLNRGEETVSAEPNASVKAAEPVRINEGPSAKALEEENFKLKEELEFKKKRNDELYRENEELKRKLESAEKALDESKK